MLNYMIDIGHRTGLFTAAAAGPATSEELADRAGLNERYVREWLGAMVTGGIVDYEPATTTYIAAAEPRRAADRRADEPRADGCSSAPISASTSTRSRARSAKAAACRTSEFRPEFTDVMDGISRIFYDGLLVDACLPLGPGTDRTAPQRHPRRRRRLRNRSRDGRARPRAFPASTFVGYDLDDAAIARARAEARWCGLDNVRFEVLRRGAADRRRAVRRRVRLRRDPRPGRSRRPCCERIHDALVPGGVFVMKEPHAADALEDNIGNPMAPILYGCSTLHCMTVSLAHGGAGIGTMFGEQLALAALDATPDSPTSQSIPRPAIRATRSTSARGRSPR